MDMLLTDITKIIRVLLAAYQPIASQDNLTQRRLGQIGEVIGAVEDVAETEEQDSPVAEKRVEEAHDIIHRVAAILAMEDDEEEEEETAARNYENDSTDDDTDEPLAEVAWDGKLEGESIELKEDEED